MTFHSSIAPRRFHRDDDIAEKIRKILPPRPWNLLLSILPWKREHVRRLARATKYGIQPLNLCVVNQSHIERLATQTELTAEPPGKRSQGFQGNGNFSLAVKNHRSEPDAGLIPGMSEEAVCRFGISYKQPISNAKFQRATLTGHTRNQEGNDGGVLKCPKAS